jgi:hypothetical protein
MVALMQVTAGSAEWSGRIETIDGVEHVLNPAAPVEGERAVACERLWSIGSGEDEDEPIIGAIIDVLADAEGNSYVLDFQVEQVVVVDAEGNVIRTQGRGGEGPGEFQRPTTMCFLPGGGLGVSQMMPSRIVTFDASGNPGGDFPLPESDGFAMVQGASRVGDTIVIALQTSSFGGATITALGRLLSLDENGEILAELWRKAQEYNPAKMKVGSQRDEVLPPWTAGRTSVFISPAYEDYRIDVVGLDGTAARVIEREYESLRRTDEEIAEMKERFENFPAPTGNVEFEADPTKRDIANFVVRDNGELWVVSSRSIETAGDAGLLFEVFDPSGRYVRNARLEVDYDLKRDNWFIDAGRLYITKGSTSALRSAVGGMAGTPEVPPEEELEPPRVDCYRIGPADD